MSCQIQATSNGVFFPCPRTTCLTKVPAAFASNPSTCHWQLRLFCLVHSPYVPPPSTPFLPATQGTFTFARSGGGWRLLRPFSRPYSFLSFSSISPCSVRSRRKIEKCAFGILRPKNVEMYFSGEIYSTYLGMEVRVGGSVG